MKITPIYNKLSMWRDKNWLFALILDPIREALWDKYYEENPDMYL